MMDALEEEFLLEDFFMSQMCRISGVACQLSDFTDVRCSVCLEIFTSEVQPMLLKCNHRLCSVCTGTIGQNSQSVRCPLCSRLTPKLQIQKETLDGNIDDMLLGAVMINDIAKARQILDENPTSSNAYDIEGTSALQVAVKNDNIDMVRLLLNKGANVDHVDWGQDEQTALEIAGQKENYAMCNLLVQHGAH